MRRGTLTDHYVEDERSVVMVHESVLGLSPVATAILEAVPEGAAVSLPAVTRHVVATFGPPQRPDSAVDLTRRQVWDMVAHGILVVVDDDAHEGGIRHRAGGGQPPVVEQSGGAVTALRTALRHLRSGRDDVWSAPIGLSPAAFVAASRQHHVASYLAVHLDRLSLPDQARSELMAVAGRQRAGAETLAADLSLALDALDGAGVRALAFKGVALAAQAYDDFAARGAGDLDLLVAPDDVPRAHAALTTAGWRTSPAYPLPGPSWAWRHLVRTGNELTLVGARSEIDLHWHLVPTRGTFPSFETLWARRELVTVEGRSVPTLSSYDALTHSAGHAAKDEWRWLRSLVDVHVLAGTRDAWLTADRPLRADQLVTLGLAVREFGRPPGAPRIVDLAALEVDDSLLRRVRLEQEATAPEHRPLFPGLNFLHRLRSARLTGGTLAHAAGLVSRSALPPWVTADLESTYAVAAAPRALARRAGELATKITQR